MNVRTVRTNISYHRTDVVCAQADMATFVHTHDTRLVHDNDHIGRSQLGAATTTAGFILAL